MKKGLIILVVLTLPSIFSYGNCCVHAESHDIKDVLAFFIERFYYGFIWFIIFYYIIRKGFDLFSEHLSYKRFREQEERKQQRADQFREQHQESERIAHEEKVLKYLLEITDDEEKKNECRDRLKILYNKQSIGETGSDTKKQG